MSVITVLVIGTADTKADEIRFIQSCIETQGGHAPVMDVGVLGDPPFTVAYTKHDVARAAHTTNADIIALGDENHAMAKTAQGAATLCRALYDQKSIDAVLILGGTMGTDLALDVAAALPLGVPKCIVSTVAFSHLIPPERLTPDLMMILWAGGLYGLNSICKTVLSQAASAVLGAATSAKAVRAKLQAQPVIGMSSLGKAALKYMVYLKPELEARGYELAVFHTTGQGGRALESLAGGGHFAAVMDFSLQEVVNELHGSVVTSGASRLEAAGAAGIPQLIAPGFVDLVDICAWRDVPTRYTGRPAHAHNRLIASVMLTPEERREVARVVVAKLERARGPVAFFLPLRGVDEWDREGQDLHDPEGIAAFIDEIRKLMRPEMLIEVDAHINDPAFSQAVIAHFDAWVAEGRIAPGDLQ